MVSYVRRLQARLRAREDSEHVQVVVRFVLAACTVVLLFGIDEADAPNATQLAWARGSILVSLAIAAALCVAVVIDPKVSVTRRWIGMVHDATLLSAALYLGESVMAPYATLYLIATVANGFRFGTAYLYACAGLSVLGFATVYSASDYWRAQTTLSVNIFFMLTVVPLYVGQLLKSLQQAKEQLRAQATCDPLTGLLNRAELERRIEALLDREPSGHVLLFCDLDHFKAVNDAAGHAAGDKLLVDIARIIARAVRPTDLCSRPGGDEFCVLLLRCDLEQARAIAERIRSEIAGYRLAWAKRYFSVGISIGAAPSSAVRDMSSLFRLADAACYAAKNAGRNQIHVVDPRIDEVDTVSVRRLFLEPASDQDRTSSRPARNQPR